MDDSYDTVEIVRCGISCALHTVSCGMRAYPCAITSKPRSGADSAQKFRTHEVQKRNACKVDYVCVGGCVCVCLSRFGGGGGDVKRLNAARWSENCGEGVCTSHARALSARISVERVDFAHTLALSAAARRWAGRTAAASACAHTHAFECRFIYGLSVPGIAACGVRARAHTHTYTMLMYSLASPSAYNQQHTTTTPPPPPHSYSNMQHTQRHTGNIVCTEFIALARFSPVWSARVLYGRAARWAERGWCDGFTSESERDERRESLCTVRMCECLCACVAAAVRSALGHISLDLWL